MVIKSHPGIHLSFSVLSRIGDEYENGAKSANPYIKKRDRSAASHICNLNVGTHCTRWSKNAAGGDMGVGVMIKMLLEGWGVGWGVIG
jgi:hypothetical protein